MKGVKTLYTCEGHDSSDSDDDDDLVMEALKRRHPSRKARVFQRTPLRGFDSERAHKMVGVLFKLKATHCHLSNFHPDFGTGNDE
jgi:hypothetical protein